MEIPQNLLARLAFERAFLPHGPENASIVDVNNVRGRYVAFEEKFLQVDKLTELFKTQERIYTGAEYNNREMLENDPERLIYRHFLLDETINLINHISPGFEKTFEDLRSKVILTKESSQLASASNSDTGNYRINYDFTHPNWQDIITSHYAKLITFCHEWGHINLFHLWNIPDLKKYDDNAMKNSSDPTIMDVINETLSQMWDLGSANFLLNQKFELAVSKEPARWRVQFYKDIMQNNKAFRYGQFMGREFANEEYQYREAFKINLMFDEKGIKTRNISKLLPIMYRIIDEFVKSQDNYRGGNIFQYLDNQNIFIERKKLYWERGPIEQVSPRYIDLLERLSRIDLHMLAT